MGARVLKWIRAEAFPLLITLVLVTAARSSLADHYYVPSGSMEYTLMPGDRVIVDKTAYGIRIPLTKIDVIGDAEPSRGDVAVFDSPLDGKRLIKRIVAIGGDHVSLADGKLTVNNRPLAISMGEQFGDKVAQLNLHDGGGPDITDLEVPPGMVLALGDHRGNSLDGRFFGLVDEHELYGRAIAVYYRRGDGFTWKDL